MRERVFDNLINKRNMLKRVLKYVLLTLFVVFLQKIFDIHKLIVEIMNQ